MSIKIHPSAIVEEGARVHANVEIGPYCVIGPKVSLADGVVLKSHVVIDGATSIGAGTIVYPFASLGSPPQDLKFKGELSTLEIGSNNVIREHVTMNPGTSGGGLVTRVGNNCLFMAAAHIAHDCEIGNNVVLANNATVAGHVHIGDYAIIGGMTGIHQYVRIGTHAMIGGMSGVDTDVIPYGMVKGERARLAGLNVVGLERHGFGREEIKAMRQAYRMLFGSEGTMSERLDEVARVYADQKHITGILEFIRLRSSRALCQPQDDEIKGAA